MTHDTLEDQLGFAFRTPELLSQALTHRSFGAVHNERLEFIGDAVLDCAIAAILYRRFPRVSEGELSRMRAHLVNGETLARLGAALGLGDAIRLGEGELRSGGATRPSILADALDRLRRESTSRPIKICALGPCTCTLAKESWLKPVAPPDPRQITVFQRRL